MARPRCYICFNQLMYVKGKPVFAEIVIDGVPYKVHKDCAKDHKSERDKANVERLKGMTHVRHC